MANNPRQSFDKPVITRYDVEHVGGSFDAKNIPRPDPVQAALQVTSLKESAVSALAPTGLSAERYGVPKFMSRKPEPGGSGRVDPPGRRVPTLRQPVYSTPVHGPALPVFWNLDPDDWDYSGLFNPTSSFVGIGPVDWDGPDQVGIVKQ